MRNRAKQYTQRCVTLLKQGAARIDRRTRWTLVPLLVLAIVAAPIWIAAVRFRSHAAPPPDSIRAPILVYHSVAPTHAGQTAEQRLLDVDPATFQRQMAYLAANNYTVISLATLVDALEDHGSLPAKPVVITFDDGWRTQYDNALPILAQMHFTATFFVITKQVGMGSLYMGLDDLKSLQAAGMTIASHSRTHPDLVKVNDARLRDEVQGSREDLEKMLGITSELFAYPYGSWNNRVAAAVKDAGYGAARAYPGGSYNDDGDRFALHSVLVTDDMAAFERELGAPVVAALPAELAPGDPRLLPSRQLRNQRP